VTITYTKQALAEIMYFKLARLQLDENHSRWLVDGLLETSLRGIDTHGIQLFPVYLKEFLHGRCNVSPQFSWKQKRNATCLMDADNANGVVAASAAMQKAQSLAAENGIGIVVVQNTNHIGAASVYTLNVAEKGDIGICMTNSDPLVTIDYSSRAFLGTNPLAVAAPGLGKDMFNLDMATSQVAYSKIRKCAQQGEAIGNNWVAGDVAKDDFALLPLGGYKGIGLGMMVQIFTALLAGTPFDVELSHLYDEPFDKPRKIACTMICIDPAAFMEKGAFYQRISDFLALARQQSDNVILPGDKERASYTTRMKNGIPVSQDESIWITEYQNELATHQASA
jgi:LDH2 family malate/lactate/ureidoglycolate dehydrogenase